MSMATTWQAREDADLRQWWAEGMSVAEMSRRFKRSSGGIWDRVYQLGLKKRESLPMMAEILIVAALDLPHEFEESDLVLASWRLAPKRVGLRGFEDKHPDTKTVGSNLAGKSGPIKHLKWMERVGPRKLRLTHLGRQKAQQLKEEHDAKQSGAHWLYGDHPASR